MPFFKQKAKSLTAYLVRQAVKKQAVLTCNWKCKMAHPLWKGVWQHLESLHMHLPFEEPAPLVRICTEGTLAEV